MLALWGACYASEFGVPGPYHPWPETAIDALFTLNLVAASIFVVRSKRYPLRLALAILIATVEFALSAFIWSFVGASVSGYFF